MARVNIEQHSTVPSSLSLVALAVIGINGMLLSSHVAAEETVSLDTLVVTGEKIDKDIKDTTTAVTVVTEDEYANGETKSAKEIATEAPNVTTSGFGNIAVRGISGNGAATGGYALLTGARSRVATIVDGDTQDWSGYNFTPSGVWDTEQVEVLRGPQSTIQGTSAIGGAVVVKTKDPTFEDEAAVRAGLESYDNGNLKYNLAAMSSGALVDDELAYRIAVDETKGEGWIDYAAADTELDDAPDLNDSDNVNIRGKLLWKPASNPNVKAKLTLEHHKYNGEYLSWVNDSDDGYSSRTMTLDDDNSQNTRLQDSEINVIGTDIDYELSPGITNSLHVSFTKADIHFDQYPDTSTVVDIDKKTTTLENRVVFNQKDSDLTGVAGIYASRKDSYTVVEDLLTNDDVTTTTAVYGEGSYAINSKTRLITGARIENEDIDRSSGYPNYGGLIDQDTNDTYFLPKVGATYSITDATTLGATVSKGYSPGGSGFTWDANKDFYTYDAEKVTAYELSSKSRFENGATLNASVFYNDYSDYQAFIDTTYIDNIDSAHTYGAELEGTFWATQDLELRASVGVLRSKIDDYETYAGNELPSAPKTNASIGFTQYLGDNWSFGADVTYVGEYYSDLDNTEDYKAGDYVTADARVQYTQGNFTIDGYVKNLANEDVVYYETSSRASVGQSRTIGLSATYRL